MSNKGKSSGAAAGVDVPSLYADLVKFQNTGDFDKALKACNKILNVSPDDATAFHCRVVCLLQLGKFADVLRQMDDNAKVVAGRDLAFEKAYALYRLNKIEESLEAIKAAAKPDDPRVMELKAQVLYRLEQFAECHNLYRNLIKNTSDDFETERLTNLSAVAVYIDGKSAVDQQDTYELVYNRGCHDLAQGKWAQAEKRLEKALKMCQTFLEEEDETAEDIEKETGVIRVQIAFAKQMLGQEREAQSIYNAVLKTKPSDIGLVAVASNNLLTLNKDQNIFDSKKRIKAATAEGLDNKLPLSHRRKIARNNSLLAMYTNQVDLCKQLIKELGDKFGYDSQDFALIESGVLSRAGKTEEAVKVIMDSSVGLLEKTLIASQIYLDNGDKKKAVEVLETLPPADRYKNGILSCLVTLYLALDDRHSAAKLLKDAAITNRSPKSGSKKSMSMVWRKTAEFHLKGDEPQVAAKALEELLSTADSGSGGERQTLAQLVLAYAKFDLPRALEVSRRLPAFDHSSAVAVDVDAMENSAFLGTKYGKKMGGGLASPKPKTPLARQQEGDDLVRKKKRKQRKKKLPKNYNPNVDPDPERWLPRRERTGYKKSRKDRRNKDKFTGAQGTAAGQAENYDYAAKKAAAETGAMPKKSPAVREESKPAGPRQQQRKPQPKKKGKKNRF